MQSLAFVRAKKQPADVFYKKGVLKISQNSQESTCARVSLLIKLQPTACNFIKKETLAQVFSCEVCEIFKNIFLTEHLWTTASESLTKVIYIVIFVNYWDNTLQFQSKSYIIIILGNTVFRCSTIDVSQDASGKESVKANFFDDQW